MVSATGETVTYEYDNGHRLTVRYPPVRSGCMYYLLYDADDRLIATGLINTDDNDDEIITNGTQVLHITD